LPARSRMPHVQLRWYDGVSGRRITPFGGMTPCGWEKVSKIR
jgi:hypothetical protein